jgi:hypothetical protein
MQFQEYRHIGTWESTGRELKRNIEEKCVAKEE